jgi:hypothetical protein
MIEEELDLTNSWGEQTHTLERVLKALILDLNRIHERVDVLQKNHGPKIDAIKCGLDVLAANVQGFQTQEEGIKSQCRERAILPDARPKNEKIAPIRLPAAGECREPPAKVVMGSAPQLQIGNKHPVLAQRQGGHYPLGATRLKARQRWRWALMKIRMQMIRGRIPMTSVVIGRKNSIAVRLRQVEDLVDNTDYKIRFISTHAGPEKVKKLLQATTWLEEAFVGGLSQEPSNFSGVLSRLAHVERKCDTVCHLATAVDARGQALSGELKGIQEHLVEVARHAACAFKDATYLRSKTEKTEKAIKNALPRARREAVGLMRALRNTCFAAMRSRDIAVLPGSNKLMQGWLAPMYHQLERAKESLQNPSSGYEIDQESSVNLSQWRVNALAMARYLHVKLRDDERIQEHLNVSTLKDVPIDIVGDQAYNVEKAADVGFIIEVVDKITHARELAAASVLPLF